MHQRQYSLIVYLQVALGSLPRAVAAARFTPVAVNSAPAKCLCDFLRKGNSVMLELSQQAKRLPTNVRDRLVSHVLAAHNGLLYAHSLAIGKCSCASSNLLLFYTF